MSTWNAQLTVGASEGAIQSYTLGQVRFVAGGDVHLVGDTDKARLAEVAHPDGAAAFTFTMVSSTDGVVPLDYEGPGLGEADSNPMVVDVRGPAHASSTRSWCSERTSRSTGRTRSPRAVRCCCRRRGPRSSCGSRRQATRSTAGRGAG